MGLLNSKQAIAHTEKHKIILGLKSFFILFKKGCSEAVLSVMIS